MSSSPSRRPLDAQAAALGRSIREARSAAGLTLVQVAERAKLSHPFLSQLERGLVRPSMSSLFRIAEALGTSQQLLLAQAAERSSTMGSTASPDPADPPPTLSAWPPGDGAETTTGNTIVGGTGVRRGELVRSGDGASAGLGSGTATGRARMLVVGEKSFFPMEYASTAVTFDEFFVHDADEFVFVIDGAMEVDLGDGECYRLGIGDSLHYPGGTPHRWRAIDAGGYRVIAVQAANRSDGTGR